MVAVTPEHPGGIGVRIGTYRGAVIGTIGTAIIATAVTHITVDAAPAWATDGTAIGTIGLAIATFVLALKTRALAKSGQATAEAAKDTADAAKREIALLSEQTDAAKRQSEAAEGALNASVAPLLLDVPRHTIRRVSLPYQSARQALTPPEVDASVINAQVDEKTAYLIVPIRNVGAGIARLDEAFVTPEATVAGIDAVPGDTPSVIAQGELDHLAFVCDDDHPEGGSLRQLLASGQSLVVEVAYTDISGRQPQATALRLVKSDQRDRAYRVDEVLPAVDLRLTAAPPLPHHWSS